MQSFPLYDEKKLFSKIALGDETAFRQVFDLYKTTIFSIALKMLKTHIAAEEITQEVFLSIWVNKTKFNTISEPQAYIITVAYNKIYRHLKLVANEAKLLQTVLQSMNEVHNNTEEMILAHESETLINKAVEQLPPQRQKIYKLSRHMCLSHEEIAQQLHISRNTVKNQLVEALKFIRLHLQETASLLAAILLYFQD